MTTAAYFGTHAESFLTRLATGLKAVGAHMVAAREKEARRYVGAYLASLDEASLTRLGLTRDDVARMPKAPYTI